MQDDFLSALIPVDEADPVVMAIRQATHSIENSVARWEARRTTGLSDYGLKVALGEEFGTQGGFMINGLDAGYKGGRNPSLSITRPVKLELKGATLVARVREALGIRQSEVGGEDPDNYEHENAL